MRRKQLYAFILAGALAMSSAPAAVFAAEGETAAASETSEEAPAEGDSAADDSSAQETPAEETPAPETPEEPAAEETPVPETPVTEAPAEQPQEQEETPAPEVTETPDVGETSAGILVTINGVTTPYNTIQEAIDNVPAPTTDAEGNVQIPVVEITKDQSISAPITVKDGKRVSITATAQVKFTRAEGFTDEMFTVSGADSELALEVEGDGASLTLDGTSAGTVKTLISVSDSASLEVYDGVTLTNNITTDNGGAISNNGGKLMLAGGTVTANTGARGAVYSTTTVCVQGGIQVTENKNSDGAAANLFVELADTSEPAVKVTGAFAETAAVGYTDAAAEAGKTVIAIGKNEADQPYVSTEEFAKAVAGFKYDAAGYEFKVSKSGDTATLEKTADTPEPPVEEPFKVTQVGQVTASDWENYSKVTVRFTATEDCKYYGMYVDGKAFDDSKAQKKASKGKTITLTAKNISSSAKSIVIYAKSISTGKTTTCVIPLENRPAKPAAFELKQQGDDTWYKNNHNKLKQVKVTTNHNCNWYYELVASGTKAADIKYDKSKKTKSAKAGSTLPLKAIEVKDGNYALAVVAKSTEDETVQKIVIEFKNRPEKKAARAARTYTINDNKVSGLEGEMKFFPGKAYSFTVEEAGMADKEYIAGDERYQFAYWSTSSDGSNPQSKMQIMASKGMSTAKSIPLYVFFQKYRFNGEGWDAVGKPEALQMSFQSAGYTEEELQEYLKEAKENGTVIPGYENETGGGGSGEDAELTATAAASEKDAGSKSKSAVSTADESPIGTMSALAVLSLLAGGYVVVRKRKREEQ